MVDYGGPLLCLGEKEEVEGGQQIHDVQPRNAFRRCQQKPDRVDVPYPGRVGRLSIHLTLQEAGSWFAFPSTSSA